jgi:dimethylhistidine N-methyltransferase
MTAWARRCSRPSRRSPGRALIDLGAGDCRKAGRLFAALQPRRYVAVDISADYLRDALAELQRRHPAVEMHGVGIDFSQSLVLPAALVDAPLTVFFAGSSIGNFTPDDARAFLSRARALGPDASLLIGVDLVKDPAVLEAAYDDALGVTAAFNLNLLRHLNRLLGADFDVRDWQHVARFDPVASRIEMHLQARRALNVRWPGGDRDFSAGERVHTENSYKYRRSDFESLLRDAGYGRIQAWTDEREWFAVFAAR